MADHCKKNGKEYYDSVLVITICATVAFIFEHFILSPIYILY